MHFALTDYWNNRAHCYSTERYCAMHFSLLVFCGCGVKSFKAKPVAINTQHVLNFFVGRNGFWFKVNQLQP